MSDSPYNDADLKLVLDAVKTLREHFDSVQIFCSRYEFAEEGTTHIARGEGNWFARYGQVRDWLVTEDEQTKEKIRHDNDDTQP